MAAVGFESRTKIFRAARAERRIASQTNERVTSVNRLATLLVQHSKTWIGSSWLISLSALVFVLVLADFGGPSWIFIVCGFWLCSFGLPTTLSLVALAGVWGKVPGVEPPPLGAFAVSVAIISLVAQAFWFHAAVRFLNRS